MFVLRVGDTAQCDEKLKHRRGLALTRLCVYWATFCKCQRFVVVCLVRLVACVSYKLYCFALAFGSSALFALLHFGLTPVDRTLFLESAVFCVVAYLHLTIACPAPLPSPLRFFTLWLLRCVFTPPVRDPLPWAITTTTHQSSRRHGDSGIVASIWEGDATTTIDRSPAVSRCDDG